MSGQVTRLHVFAASPGDTTDERDRLAAVVAELNRGIAAEKGLVLELVRWETHVRPGIGRDAQAVINAQVADPDIVVAMFWKRLGTPTPRAPSGTAEEIATAIERWRQADDVELLVYFNQHPFMPSADDIDEFSRLRAFRSELQDLGVLVWEYDGAADFETKVRQHLASAIRARPAAAVIAAPGAASAGIPLARGLGAGATFSARLDARDAPDVHAVVADVRAGLRTQDFGRGAADRVATVLLELIANVREHVNSPEAVVEASVRSGSLLGVALTVWHTHASFDLAGALNAGWRAYERGEREHGLVKVARLTSGLRLVEGDDSRIGVRCSVFDLPSIGSGVFNAFPSVRPASIEFDVPRRCILDGDPYDAAQLRDVFEFALSNAAPRVLALAFGGMEVRDDDYLGIELAGNVLPSEIRRKPPSRGWRVAHGRLPRSHDAIEAAFEVRFRSAFEDGRVILHAFETGYVPTAMAQEWAARWDAPCFTEPDALRQYLRERVDA